MRNMIKVGKVVNFEYEAPLQNIGRGTFTGTGKIVKVNRVNVVIEHNGKERKVRIENIVKPL